MYILILQRKSVETVKEAELSKGMEILQESGWIEASDSWKKRDIH